MQCIGRGRKIHSRRHGRKCLNLVRRFTSPFARQLQHQISAHRESNNGNAIEGIFIDQFFCDGADVG